MRGSDPLDRAIVDAVARSHRLITGRGPSRVRAFHDEDLVVVLLHDMLTAGERSLVDDGRPDAVRSVREQLRPTLRRAFVEAIERPTRRTVQACLSDTHIDPDLTVVVFVLDRPLGGAGQRPAAG